MREQNDGRRRRYASAAMLSLALTPALASAQAATQAPAAPDAAAATVGQQPAGEPGRVTGRRTYDAAYFAPFSPASALQMVERVPGFAIEAVDPSVRGFGQVAGNVVINGQRPSAKTDTIDVILERIPASRVLRIEVGAGQEFGADFASKAQVVNVVLTAAGGLAGSVEATARRTFVGDVLPEGKASALWKHGASSFNLAAQLFNRTSTEQGYDRVSTIPDGVTTEFRDKVNHQRDPNGSLSGSWSLDGGTDRTAHLNASYTFDHFRLHQDNHVTFPASGDPARDDALIERRNADAWELGGDVTRPFAGGGLKLTALASRTTQHFDDLALTDLAAPTGNQQLLRARSEESLARLTWSRAALGGWSVEAGGEAALNTLDSNVLLDAIDVNGVRTPIDLPVADARVRELRGEAFVNAGRALSPTLRLDLGLTGETSRLTVSGDASARRTLTFLKPKAVLDWKPTAKWHAQLSLQRTVNQLQFGDFVSSAELSNNRVDGGNPNLVPQRSWELLGTLERTVLTDGLARIELGYTRISQAQDRVPTEDGFDAPGNLGDGRVLIARARVEAPLHRLGLPGARLTLYGSYVSTSVRDPYTGRERPFSDNSLFAGSAEFRQDLGAFAWGVSAQGGTPSTGYRLDELDTHAQEWYVTAFGEWRPTSRTTLTFSLENVTDIRSTRDRRFFLPNRTTPDPYLREFRFRRIGVTPALTFKHTFG